MNSLVAYDDPEWFPESVGSSDGYYITPYPDLTWRKTAHEFGVKTPDHIVDRTHGTSVCQNCKQVYSGFQNKCVKEKLAYKTKRKNESDYWATLRFGSCVTGEKINVDYYGKGDIVVWHGYAPCGGSCEWSAKDAFSKQELFFSFLRYLDTVPKNDNSVFAPYRDLMQPGSPEVLERRVMLRQIQYLELQNVRLESAVKMIVDKMNNAGHSLIF